MDRNNPEFHARMDSFLDDARLKIAEHGHLVMHVFPTEHDPPGPSFSYSIGLAGPLGYELITIGLPGELACFVINQTAELLKAGAIEDGVDINDFTNLPFRLKTHAIHDVTMGVAHALGYPYSPLRQILWPDPQGNFPDNPAYNFAHDQDLAFATHLGKPH